MVKCAVAGVRVSPAGTARVPETRVPAARLWGQGEWWRGGLSRALLLLTLGLVMVSALPAAAAPTVWVVPSMERVRPDTAAGTATEISLSCAKGEYESFQIIVKAPTGGLTNVNVTAPTLSAAQFTLYREHYVYVADGTADWSSNLNKPEPIGWFPDGLIPFKNPSTGADLSGATLDAVPFTLAAGKNQPVWVDVYVPREAAAGAYQAIFTVTSTQGQATVALNLTVWNFAIPVTPALQSSFLYWSTSRNGAGRGILVSDQELLRNRLMPINTSTSNEAALIAMGYGATSIGPYANASNSAGTCDPPPSLSDLLTRKASHDSRLRLYDYSMDEISNTALYDDIQAWGRRLHEAGVDNLVTMPPNTTLMNDGSGTGRSAVDIWVELPKQYNATLVNQVITKGDEVWSYNCLQQDNYSPKWLLDYHPINYRIQPGFINQSLNMTGLLYWRVDYWTDDAWNDPMTYSATGYVGEGLLVYPGATVGLTGVAPSMRIKYLRDGVDDYDYVNILKGLGQGEWALSVARSVGPDWTNWTRDANAVEAARLQLGARINSLMGAPHTLSATASASPTSVASSGSASLTATATDSAGDGIASWAWSDGGAGGIFSPSASVQNPTYLAAANTSGASRTVTLTVTATCNGSSPISTTASTTLTVQSATHSITASAAVSPSIVVSSGVASLSSSASDSLAHAIAAWSWSDGGAGGTFSPSTSAQNPSYTAAPNITGVNRTVMLTVTATCGGAIPVSGAASTTLVVQTVPHELLVTAASAASEVASSGSVGLSATASDSLGHMMASWAWSDGGAGGSFAPSAAAQNPTYTAPANTNDSVRAITLTVSVTCAGSPSLTRSASVALSVSPVPDVVTVTADLAPAAVDSAGTATLTASATDSRGHAIASWQWQDGGAGGAFSPSATVANPAYTAPANSSGADLTIILTVTVTCSGPTPKSDTDSVSLTVHTEVLPLSVEAGNPMPSVVPSEATTDLTATTSDTEVDQLATWRWDDGSADGTFEPSATVRNPHYRAPRNTTGRQMQVVLTVSASCSDPTPLAGSDTTAVIVEPAAHALTVTATADPRVVSWKGRTTLYASYDDTFGHAMSSWRWSDNGAGGVFSPSATVQNPAYKVPNNSSGGVVSIILSVVGTCNGPTSLTATGYVTLTVQSKPGAKSPSLTADGMVYAAEEAVTASSFADIPAGFWAADAISACEAAGIIAGYPDGNFRPDWPVTRDQAAIYFARAVAGGDEFVPAGPAEASFSDLPTTHWAFRYVEYAKAKQLVQGLPDGRFLPAKQVTRAEMATFVARAIVEPTGDDGLTAYEPPTVASFPDVPVEYWAFRYVEFLADRGLAKGYQDGRYLPDQIVSRAETAVYLARAFGLTG